MPLFESYGAEPLQNSSDNLLDITRDTLATLGAVYITPMARAMLKEAGLTPVALAVAQANGLWQGVDAYEAHLNDTAMASGGPMRSVYPMEGKGAVWVLTQQRDALGKRPGTLILAAYEFANGLEGEGD